MIELMFKQIKQNFPLRYFWGGEPQCYQDKDLLRTHGPAADGGDQEEVRDEEVVRQYDHRDQNASDELCEPDGVRKGHLQGFAKGVRCAAGLFALILKGRATLDLQQVFFRLKPNIDKGCHLRTDWLLPKFIGLLSQLMDHHFIDRAVATSSFFTGAARLPKELRI